ncbi:hypothetical protein A6M21_10765 [Desulfotomaculum copahuensis]|uniref:Uncharacterized protein n=1 Tax=Desulfotomaculum copahuensis TaxID=1838280 RepID=A0A1B7LE73_9FIRM|nr:hypothetical protein A6M21_10765 [Desulfotomaculum copahuensis]
MRVRWINVKPLNYHRAAGTPATSGGSMIVPVAGRFYIGNLLPGIEKTFRENIIYKRRYGI